MGKSKTTVNAQTGSTTTPQLSPAEQEFQQLQLERERAAQGGILGTQQQGFNLIQALLSGQALPGGYGNPYGGINEDVLSSITQKSIEDLAPQFQAGGLLDSGVRASVSARVAGDIRRQAEQFNILNRFNMLQLALGGQAQVQQPAFGYSSQLAQSLSGLRPTTTVGSSSQSSYAPNPFLTSFQTAFGNSLGSMPTTAVKTFGTF